MQCFRPFALSVLGVSLALVSAVPAYASTPPATDRIIVKYKQQPGAVVLKARTAMRAAVLKTAGRNAGVDLKVVRARGDGTQVVSLGKGKAMKDVLNTINELMADPAVEYAEPDLIMYPKAVPNDPKYGEQWHYYEANAGLNLPNAWDYTQGSGAVVAVLDTGYRDHVDLVDNILPGYDFVTDLLMANDGDGRDADALDPGDHANAGECGFGYPEHNMVSSWHGTHVTGTVAAVSNNGIGVAGVAGEAKVVPVRVLGKCGGYTSDIADAIMWAAGYSVAGVPDNQNPANVINMSLGGSSPSNCSVTYSNAIQAARDAGTTVVVAAGNENDNADLYSPANCDGVITVSAVNRDGGRASYSNFGSVVDIAAPGGDGFGNRVLSTSNYGPSSPQGDSYSYYQGTSMAAPHIAGLAALLYSVNSELTPDDVANMIKSTSRDFAGACQGCGVGLADAHQAVLVASGIQAPTEVTDLELLLIGTNGKYRKIDDTQGAVTYNAEIRNLGDLDTTNVALTSQFAPDFTFVSATPTQGSCSNDGLTCDLGDMAVGDSVTVAFEFVTGVENAKLKDNFTGSVSSDLVDVHSSNNFVITKFGGALTQLLLALGAFAVLRRVSVR